MRLTIAVCLAVFAALAAIVLVVSGDDWPGAVAGVGLAAGLSLLWMMRQMRSQWSGTVVDLEEREYGGGADEQGSVSDVR